MLAKGGAVTTIGSNPFIQAASTPQTGGADSARLAAQKAFFEAAMGRPAAPAAPVQAAASVAQPVRQDFRASPQMVAEAQDQPRKILRPGSLLNIIV
jgi:hypothetical protein